MHTFSIRTGLVAITIVWLTASACKPIMEPVATLSSPQEMKALIEASDAPLTWIHVWATWCQPCREEFPDLLKVYQENSGNGLVLKLISADAPGDLEVVEAFLREHHSPVDSLVSTELNQDFIEMLSRNWSGALPASFFFDSTGKLVAESDGAHSFEEYEETIQTLLKP